MATVLVLLIGLSYSKESILTSQAGLSIECSKSGISTTKEIIDHDSDYRISGAS